MEQASPWQELKPTGTQARDIHRGPRPGLLGTDPEWIVESRANITNRSQGLNRLSDEAETGKGTDDVALPKMDGPVLRADAPDLAQAHQCLSVDLVESSRRLVKLLMAVDCYPHGGLYHGPYTRVAVHRYETQWLPLLAARPDDPNLIPPVDVAYAWLCHRLAPAAYASDCMIRFGRVLHPATPEQALAFEDGSTAHATVKLWGSVGTQSSKDPRPRYFPPEFEPITVQLAQDSASYTKLCLAEKELKAEKEGYRSRKSEFKYDVAGAMARQGGFLRNVLRASYSEMPFLQRAVDRYLRFVLLWRDSPGLKVVPMYDIDLMWHAHMVHTGVYQNDMHNIAGKVLNHDDNLEDSELSGGFTATKSAFEARWDMLYDPPLTRKVPPGEQHPAQRVVGAPLTQLLAGPLSEDTEVILWARYAMDQANDVKTAQALVRQRITEGKVAAQGAQSVAARKRTEQAKKAVEDAAAVAKEAYGKAERARMAAQWARSAHEKAYPLQGGAALYSLYLVTKGMHKAKGSCWTMCLCGSVVLKRMKANRSMVKVMKGIPKFKPGAGPFSHSHPFWSELRLVAYDSPVTVWRTPPGSAPGTLAATLAAVAASKGKAAPVMGFPSTAEGTPVYPSNVPTIYRGITPTAPPQPYNNNNNNTSNPRGADAATTKRNADNTNTNANTGTAADSSMLMYAGMGAWTYPDLYYQDPPTYAAPAMGSSYCPYDCCALGGAYAATPDLAAQVTPGTIGDVRDMPGSVVGGGMYGDAASYTEGFNETCALAALDLGNYGSSIGMGLPGHAGDIGYSGIWDSDGAGAKCAAATCGAGAACGGGGSSGGCGGGGCGGCGGSG